MVTEINSSHNSLMDFSQVASKERQEKTKASLEQNGFTVLLVETGEAAKQKVLELLPDGAEVMNMTSQTLETAGIVKAIEESGRFTLTRTKLSDPTTDPRDKKRYGAAPEWVLGSIHALTEDGQAMIASNTGSQLPAYVYGSDHVIWVVGAQKIVTDLNQGHQRLEEYVLPLEDARARVAYGVPSAINNLLVMKGGSTAKRVTIILVNKKLGF